MRFLGRCGCRWCALFAYRPVIRRLRMASESEDIQIETDLRIKNRSLFCTYGNNPVFIFADKHDDCRFQVRAVP
jgi:hypothetical protein